MNFPAYVPAAVRIHVSRILPIITNILTAPSGQCPPVVREFFEEHNKTGDYYDRRFKSFLDEHRATIIEKRPNLKELKLHKECLIRLAQDERMREAYCLLAKQFCEDERWHKLVWAAAAASLDFHKYRIGLSNASELCDRIAQVTDYIGFLFNQLDACHVKIPAFYSLSALLDEEATDDLDKMAGNRLIWLRVKDVLEQIGEKARATASKIDNRDHDASNRYSWGVEGFEYNSPQNALLMSALKSRQSNPKTEYLRAFGCALRLNEPDALTSIVQKAMAEIATVVINDPIIVVTYDDVRAVFTKDRPRNTRNSGKDMRVGFPPQRKTARSHKV
jgi:hypothetical protein